MSTPDIYTIINDLADQPSRIQKEIILNAHRNNDLLKNVFRLTYDPMVVFGIKKIPERDASSPNELTLYEGLQALRPLEDGSLTGNAAIAHLQDTLSKMSDNDAWVLERVVKKNLRCGVSVKTLNKIWGSGFVMDFPVMLAEKHEEKNLAYLTFPAMGQMKYNGMRVQAISSNGTVKYFSRNGKQINLDHPALNQQIMLIEMRYGKPVVIDGELIGYDVDDHGNEYELTRKESNGIASKAIKKTITREESEKFKINAWDIIPFEVFQQKKPCADPYVARYTQLNVYIESCISYLNNSKDVVSNRPYIIPAETQPVESIEDAKELAKQYLQEGFEGAIIKNTHSLWVPKRSKDLVKIKGKFDGDFKIVGILEGKNQFEGMVGSFLIETECGVLTCNVGTGLTPKERQHYFDNPPIGEICEVEYNDVIKNSKGELSLYLPVFVEIRPDKNVANTLDELEQSGVE